jgi:hypothetical protein
LRSNIREGECIVGKISDDFFDLSARNLYNYIAEITNPERIKKKDEERKLEKERKEREEKLKKQKKKENRITVKDVVYRIKPKSNIAVVAGLSKHAGRKIEILSRVTAKNGKEYPVKRIKKKAFEFAPLVQIVIPEGIKVIEEGSFYFCKKLAYVQLPASLEAIEENAFAWCNSLMTLWIPDNVVDIADNAFSASSQIVLGSYGNYLEQFAQDNCMEHAERYDRAKRLIYFAAYSEDALNECIDSLEANLYNGDDDDEVLD